MGFLYKFDAVRGLQAKNVYYISMVPIGLLSKIFITDSDYILPEYRAQRKINKKRIPELKNYILQNRNSYVFSALSASISGDFTFNPVNNTELGVLEIDMSSTFLINDGQHRKAALEEALIEDSSLYNETISIVFFEDKGLIRSQQMFTDLNKHAVVSSKSLNTLYDSNDDIAVFTKDIVRSVDFFRIYTDMENDTLGKYSQKLFTLNNFYNANMKFLSSVVLDTKNEEYVKRYWRALSNSIEEWIQLQNKQLLKKTLREDYIVTQGVVLLALGKLGNYFIKNNINDFEEKLNKLRNINWLRSNPIWEGRTLRNGKIDRREKNINLTYIKIKELIGIKLTEEENLQNSF